MIVGSNPIDIRATAVASYGVYGLASLVTMLKQNNASSFWRGGRNGIIAPILKIGGGDEPSVGSYPALSAKDA